MKKRSKGTPATTHRQSERLTITLPVSILVSKRAGGNKEQTTTVNLSRTGVSFKSHQSYRLGMKLGITFKGTADLFRKARGIPAEVMRVVPTSTEGDSIVGARFEEEHVAGLVLLELLRAQMRVSMTLLEVIQALSPGAEVREVVESICKATGRALEAENTLLFLPDRDHKVFRAQNRNDALAEEFQIRPGKGLLGAAISSKRLINMAAPAKDPHFRPEWDPLLNQNTRSVLAVPLDIEKGLPLGLLVILNKRYGSFTKEDAELCSAVAQQISVVLREAFLFETIRNMKNFNERILRSIANCVVTFDPSGKLTFANHAATKILGLHPQKDTGKEISSLFHQTANSRLLSLTEGVLKTQRRRTAYDVRFQRNDGTNFSLNLTALPLTTASGEGTESEFLGGVLVAEDITQEQRFMNTLCRYLAREVAEQVMADKDMRKLGGRRTEATILMADIRNFTTISEQMDPKDLMELLNTYFPRMINVIFRHQGMVDKLIGDAILAVFGVPMRREDDAIRAVQAALAMRKELANVNKELARKGYKPLDFGIGITSGTVISGNIGSERRMDFTVIGDPVNLAARLEGLTKEVQRKILINDRVHEAIVASIPCEALGLFNVKGKLEKIPVFAVKSAE